MNAMSEKPLTVGQVYRWLVRAAHQYERMSHPGDGGDYMRQARRVSEIAERLKKIGGRDDVLTATRREKA